VPVTLAARAVGDALARVQEHEVDPEPALSWLGWDGEGPLLHHGLRASALAPAPGML
jgi:hypothetical protein